MYVRTYVCMRVILQKKKKTRPTVVSINVNGKIENERMFFILLSIDEYTSTTRGL